MGGRAGAVGAARPGSGRGSRRRARALVRSGQLVDGRRRRRAGRHGWCRPRSPQSGAETSLATMRSTRLAASFVGGVLAHVARSRPRSRRANWRVLAARRARRGCRRSARAAISGTPSRFLSFSRRSGLRAGSRRPRRPSRRRRRSAKRAEHRVVPSPRRVSTATTSTRTGGAGRPARVVTSVTAAPRLAAASAIA